MVATIELRGVVRAHGDDATTYLQGQVSQDLDAVAPGDAAWSLVLDPTGKLVSWFRIHRVGADEYLLDVEPAGVEPTVARLERFKLRTAVEFVVETGWRMVSVRGEETTLHGDLVATVDWPGWAGTDVLLAPTSDDPAIDVDAAAFEEARIRAGVPRLGTDLTADTIPAEGGSALIEGAVSFTKGCYTGQELVARIDSRGGNVPRPLRVIEAADGAALTAGAPVAYDGGEIGTLTSAAGPVGLGRLLRKAEIGAAISVGGVAARIIAPTG